MELKKKDKNSREVLQRQFNNARSNLLLMLAFTVLNIVLLVLDTGTMFLFSATVPYYAVLFAMIEPAIMYHCIAIAAISIIAYLLCWIFSKKQFGWMIAALVLFVIDTIAMLDLYITAEDASGILDLVIHVWVLWYLVIGVISGVKLSKLPAEELETVVMSEDGAAEGNAQLQNSAVIRIADTTVKARILLEADVNGRNVCYRRVKRVNELVIDGNVYDEVEMLVESPHELTAVLDGHNYAVGTNATSQSYISVDGETVKKKLRLV